MLLLMGAKVGGTSVVAGSAVLLSMDTADLSIRTYF